MNRYEAERLMLALAESSVPEGGSMRRHEGQEPVLIVRAADESGVASFQIGTSNESPEVFCIWECLPRGKRVCHVSPEVSFPHGV